MLVTYLLLLLIAIVFKILHFPGTGLIFIISPLFPLIDIIIQSIRKKGDKETRVLSSIGVFILSLFLLFKFLYWPGNQLLFWIAIAVLVVFVFRFFQKKINFDTRFYITILLFFFAIFNFSIKRSDFRLTYLLEDPFNPSEPVPHFYIQSLAYEYYWEGDFSKAEKLIQRNIHHITDLTNQQNVHNYSHDIDNRNLEISKNDLENIRNHTWNNFVPLYREDRHID